MSREVTGRKSHRGFRQEEHEPSMSGQSQHNDHREDRNLFIAKINTYNINSQERLKENPVIWILESGCTDHIINCLMVV